MGHNCKPTPAADQWFYERPRAPINKTATWADDSSPGETDAYMPHKRNSGSDRATGVYKHSRSMSKGREIANSLHKRRRDSRQNEVGRLTIRFVRQLMGRTLDAEGVPNYSRNPPLGRKSPLEMMCRVKLISPRYIRKEAIWIILGILPIRLALWPLGMATASARNLAVCAN